MGRKWKMEDIGHMVRRVVASSLCDHVFRRFINESLSEAAALPLEVIATGHASCPTCCSLMHRLGQQTLESKHPHLEQLSGAGQSNTSHHPAAMGILTPP